MAGKKKLDLHTRLEKLASGVSVDDAIESYLASIDSDAPPADAPIDLDAEVRAESEAIVEIMFLMAAVDGHISDIELEQLRASLGALRDMGAIGSVDVDASLEAMGARLDEAGWGSRIRAAAARVRAPEARDFAFRLAAGIAFVDDHVAHGEAAAIDSLAGAFGFTQAESQAILREVYDTLFGG